MLALVLSTTLSAPPLPLGDDGAPPCTAADCAAAEWLHIPGPNPLLIDDNDLEMAGGLFEEDGQYVMMYHRTKGSEGFTAEAATSSGKYGPFTPLVGPGPKGSESILPLGKKGSWDTNIVASHSPSWNGTAWNMAYIGSKNVDSYEVGMAHSQKLVGPWKKSSKEPVIKYSASTEPGSNDWEKQSDGFYTGGLQYGPHTNNEYWLYAETVSGNTDYGPMALWTSSAPLGPWKRKTYTLYPPGVDKNAGQHCSGAWDCGGYSESGVKYSKDAGLFFTAFAGVDFRGPHYRDFATKGRFVKKNNNGPVPNGDYEEHIGFAFSADGMNWTRSMHNKIGPCSSGTPTTQAYAESHLYLPKKGSTEEGSFSVYHTQRFDDNDKNVGEMLGVEVFVNVAKKSTWSSSWPLWYNRSIANGEESDCEFTTNGMSNSNKGSKPVQGGVFCPPVIAQVSPKVQPGMVAARADASVLSLGWTFHAQIDGDSINATLNVHESEKGLKLDKTTDKIHKLPLQGSCPHGSCTINIDGAKYASANWIFASVTAGSEKLEQARLDVNLAF